jgi:replicative DNA helicase
MGEAPRVPPHSAEAEQSVLGALLQDNTACDTAARLLADSDFYCAEHAHVWRAIMRLAAKSKPADLVTVQAELVTAGVLEDVGGIDYLQALEQCVPSARNVAAHAGVVKHHAMRRRLMRLAGDLMEEARSGCGGPEALNETIGRATQALLDLQRGGADDWPRAMAELMPGWMDELLARYEGKTDAIPTGLRGVDRALADGLRRGDLVVVGARPSMGKSAYTLGLVRAVAAVGPVLVCTLEDSCNMLISRQVASTGRVNLADVRSPQRAPDSMWAAVTDATAELGAIPIYLDDRAGIGLQQVRQKARYVQSKAGGLAMVVVDYLQLMEDQGESRAYELAAIARGLKRMAKEMNCVVVLLSQLSREADKTNAPPRLDHLAESGAIEQAADIIGLLWRESRRNPKPGNEKTAQIEFVKNKNGPTDTVQLFFDGATQRFEDMAYGASGGDE